MRGEDRGSLRRRSRSATRGCGAVRRRNGSTLAWDVPLYVMTRPCGRARTARKDAATMDLSHGSVASSVLLLLAMCYWAYCDRGPRNSAPLRSTHSPPAEPPPPRRTPAAAGPTTPGHARATWGHWTRTHDHSQHPAAAGQPARSTTPLPSRSSRRGGAARRLSRSWQHRLHPWRQSASRRVGRPRRR